MQILGRTGLSKTPRAKARGILQEQLRRRPNEPTRRGRTA
jgi:hypothetical protein